MKELTMFALLAAALSGGASTAPVEGTTTYSIRVTSSVAEKEVQFEGAYLFNGSDAALHVVRQSTPFETRAEGQLGMGIFRKTGGEAQLIVEVVTTRDGKVVSSHRASDGGVIFGENLLEEVPSFARTFAWPRRGRCLSALFDRRVSERASSGGNCQL